MTPIACPWCLSEHRGQRTRYDIRSDLYVCLVHGPCVTAEFVAHVTAPEPRPGAEWWRAGGPPR